MLSISLKDLWGGNKKVVRWERIEGVTEVKEVKDVWREMMVDDCVGRGDCAASFVNPPNVGWREKTNSQFYCLQYHSFALHFYFTRSANYRTEQVFRKHIGLLYTCWVWAYFQLATRPTVQCAPPAPSPSQPCHWPERRERRLWLVWNKCLAGSGWCNCSGWRTPAASYILYIL